jgi:hypothetical protein
MSGESKLAGNLNTLGMRYIKYVYIMVNMPERIKMDMKKCQMLGTI